MTRAAPAIATPRPSSSVKVVTVKMPVDYLEMLRALEKRLGVNQSEVIRLAIERLHERVIA